MRVDKLYEIIPDKGIFAGNGGCVDKNADFLKQRKATLIWHPSWLITIRSIRKIRRWKTWFESFGGSLVVACNDPAEVSLCRLFGIRAELLNQNMHESENEFVIVDTKKVNDAIYIAQARKFKRMWLASEVDPLYVLTYGCGDYVNEAGENDLAAFEPRIAHALWNKRFIHDRQALSALISSAHAGLALSKKEGAMWASVQYLLCGIPVVTTPSKGGRDHFLGDNLSYATRATPLDVKKTIDRVKAEQRDPVEIRRTILSKMEAERQRYMVFLAEKLGVLDRACFETFHERVWGGANGILSHQRGD